MSDDELPLPQILDVWADNGANLWWIAPEDYSGVFDPEELGLPEDFVQAFRAWARRTPSHHDREFHHQAYLDDFEAEGDRLARELKRFYGDRVEIRRNGIEVRLDVG